MVVFVVPEECNRLLVVKLADPRNGSLKNFFYDEENFALYEATRYYDKFRSFFFDNQFVRDASLNQLIRIDPLFILLPQIIKYASHQFRTIYDICSESYNSHSPEGSVDRLESVLKPDIKWENICETRDVDDETYVRYCESKTIDWLMKKYDKVFDATKNALQSTGDTNKSFPSEATISSYAIDFIDLYINNSLSDKFKSVVRSKRLLLPDNRSTNISSRNASLKRSEEGPSFYGNNPKIAGIDPKREAKKKSDQSSSAAANGGIMRFFKKKPS